MRNVARLLMHQVRLEQRAFWRNPDAAFFTFALPIVLLLIFGAISGDEPIPGRSDVRGLTLFVPGILAFGIIVAAYGTLASTIAILRADGVLKRVRATPLPATVYLTAQLVSALVTCLLIAVSTVVLGRIAFGVAPRSGGILPLVATLSLSIVCFAALALALSGFIPSASSAGPITNGTYLPLALVSGTFTTTLSLPGWLDPIISALPIRALTQGLRATYDPAVQGWSPGNLVVLVAWSIIGILLALRYFRWEPS